MGMELRVLMVMAMVITLITAASAASGTATFYKQPYVPSACYGYQDNGVMIAGASDAIWENKAACGRMYSVRCTRAVNTRPHPCLGEGSITVKIVDYCASCNGTINLSQDAFEKIADLQAGKISVEYNHFVYVRGCGYGCQKTHEWVNVKLSECKLGFEGDLLEVTSL